MRYLAIDLGEKRTGFACGDDVTGLVSPMHVATVPRGPALLEAVQDAAAACEAQAIIIGLPVNMDTTEGPAAKNARTFGEQLAQTLHLPVQYQDERLTSYAADQHMARSGRTHKQKKSLRDALAAAEILRDYFDVRR